MDRRVGDKPQLMSITTTKRLPSGIDWMLVSDITKLQDEIKKRQSAGTRRVVCAKTTIYTKQERASRRSQ